MKYGTFWGFMILAATCIAHGAAGKSMLSAESFPKTFADLSFVDRMAVLADGYSPWETVYDASGKCISGCSYQGMTIEDELAAIEKNTQSAVRNLNGEYKRASNDGTTPATISDESGTVPAPATQAAIQRRADITGCAQRSTTIPQANKVPVSAPLDGDLVITSDFGPRNIGTGSTNHRGLDFRAPVGTNVYAPADGTVIAVWNDTQYGGGLSIKIQHSDGYETSYCHLDRQLVKPGDTVMAGCIIAKTGNTGTSTGPHLHYGIKYNNNPIDPLWTNNFLGRTYTFRTGARSTLHQGRRLPGEI